MILLQFTNHCQLNKGGGGIFQVDPDFLFPIKYILVDLSHLKLKHTKKQQIQTQTHQHNTHKMVLVY